MIKYFISKIRHKDFSRFDNKTHFRKMIIRKLPDINNLQWYHDGGWVFIIWTKRHIKDNVIEITPEQAAKEIMLRY